MILRTLGIIYPMANHIQEDFESSATMLYKSKNTVTIIHICSLQNDTVSI